MSDDSGSAAGGVLWAAAERYAEGRRPGPRPTLRRDRIVAAGIEIADAAGLDAVSMPKVAARVGAATMALYRHVPGKNELVMLMVDTATGPAPRLPESEDWRAGLAEWARANLEVFLRHPWVLPLVTRKRVLGPNEVAWAESALRVIARSGLPVRDRLRVLMLVNGYVRGVAAEATGEATVPAAALEEFPLLRESVAADEGESLPDRFAFGLDRVLDGVEEFIRSRGQPGRNTPAG